MPTQELTAERLRELLNYDPETGVFRWKKVTSRRVKVGDVAGSRRLRGDVQIRLDGQIHLAHRLVWLYMTGEWPRGQIDHINLQPGDNDFENLRVVTDGQNKCNKRVRRDSRSGLKGVTQDRRDLRYQARIKARGKNISLGYFATAEAAHEAYCVASAELHGEFGRAK